MGTNKRWGRIWLLGAGWCLIALCPVRSEVRPAGRVMTLAVPRMAVSDLRVSARTALTAVGAAENHLPLSALYGLSLHRAPDASVWAVEAQDDTVGFEAGGTLDVRSEMTVGGAATAWRLTDGAGAEVPETAYAMRDGLLRIHAPGAYRLELTNAHVTGWDSDGSAVAAESVVFTWRITVRPWSAGVGGGCITSFACTGAEHHAGLLSLKVSGCGSLARLDCAGNRLRSLDLSACAGLSELDCSSNRLSVLRLPSDTALKSVEGARNRLRLSALHGLLSHRGVAASYGFHPQADTSELSVGEALDLSSEMELGGRHTTYAVLEAGTRHPAPASAYTEADGVFRFKTSGGRYEIYMENAAVTDYAGGEAGKAVGFSYAVSVSGGGPGPDNPDDPDDPTDPPVAVDPSLSAAPAVVYVRERTVCLSADLGEVSVHAADGRQVYRGHSRAVAVPRPGLYFVQAGGHRWKVAVR